MWIHDTGPKLTALGVSGGNVRCLLLLPLAYVAWASRRRDLPALQRLLENTAQRAKLDEESLAIARNWLRKEPAPVDFVGGFQLLTALSKAPDQPLFCASDLIKAVVWASNAAQLDREPLAHGDGPVSRSARRAIRQVAAWLEVDIGDLWVDVMAELGDDLPRSANLSSPPVWTSPESSRDAARSTATRPFIVPRVEHAEVAPPPSIPFPLLRRTGFRGLSV
jgi:hypothetical protein